MSSRPSRRAARCLALCAITGGAVLAAVACKPAAPASYPDQGKVEAAQKTWCAGLASRDETTASAGSWRHQKDCESGYPSGSAAFLGLMTKCFERKYDEFGEDAPDSGALTEMCTQDVLIGAEPGDVGASELAVARCARQERCGQVPADECRGAFARLDGTVRALLTSMFNLKAQNEIAACLAERGCAKDGDGEQKVENDCYKKARDSRVWFPLSLALDSTVAPLQ